MAQSQASIGYFSTCPLHTISGSYIAPRFLALPRLLWHLYLPSYFKTIAGMPWHKGVLQGAEKFMISWHKEEEEVSRRRATKRDSESNTTEKFF
ncbi:unnamed protein product [Ascophyllum nodosum]